MKFDLDSKSDWAALLEKLGACQSVIDDNADRSFRAAWAQSVSGKQLLWLADSVHAPAPLLRLAACDCARTALQYVPAGDGRLRGLIEVAERFARGEATEGELVVAGDAARTAEGATEGSARAAMWATVWATAGFAEEAADEAVWAAAWTGEEAAADKQLADLVRERIPFDVIAKCVAEKAEEL